MRILYEDNHLIVVNKPAGVLVQAGDRKSENLMDIVKQYLKNKYKKEGNVFLGLVHRLDRPVCGIVVFAKTSKGASRLSEQFRQRKVRKIYTAIVEGELKGTGSLIHFIKKDQEKIKAIVSDEDREGYQYAELAYKSLLVANHYSLITIQLKTGRFNQIRAQLSHIGHPIGGDTKYGFKTTKKQENKITGEQDDDLRFKNMAKGEIALCATEIEFKSATGDKDIKLKIENPAGWTKLGIRYTNVGLK